MSNVKKAILNISGTTIYYFVQLLISIVIAKAIGFEAAGVNSLALTISNVFYPLALYGVRGFQVSDIHDRFSEGDYAFMRIVTTLAAIVLFSISLLVMKLTPVVIACAITYMLVRVLEAFSDLFFAIYQKRDHFPCIYHSYVLKSLAALAFFGLALALTKNIIAVIAAISLSYLLVFIAYDVKKLRQMTSIRLSRSMILPLLRECLPLMIFTLITPFINFMVRYSVEVVFGTEILGFYSSIAIFQAVMSTMTSSIWLVYIPVFAQHYAEGQTAALRRMIRQILLFVLAILVAGIAATLAVGQPVLRIVYGQAIVPYTYLLLPIVVVSVMLSVVMLFDAILISLNRSRLLLLTNLAGAVAIAALSFPMVRHFGLSGANGVMAAGIGLQLVLTILATYWLIRERERMYRPASPD